MNSTQLNNLFRETNTTPRDFIRWAAEMSQNVQDSTISRHRAGTQGITTPWAIAYTLFFRKNI